MNGNNYNSDSEEDNNNPPPSAASLNMTNSKAARANPEKNAIVMKKREAQLAERLNASLSRRNSSASPIQFVPLPYKYEPGARRTLELADNQKTVFMGKLICNQSNLQYTSSSTIVFTEVELALGLSSGLGKGVYLKDLGQGNILIKDQFGSVFHSFQEFCLAKSNNVSIDDVVNENFLKSCSLFEKLRKSGDLGRTFKKDGGSALLANAGYVIDKGKVNMNKSMVVNNLCAKVINNSDAVTSYHNVDASPFYFSDTSNNSVSTVSVADVFGDITPQYWKYYRLVETDSGVVVCSHHTLLYADMKSNPIYNCLRGALGEDLYAIVSKRARQQIDEAYFGWSAESYVSSGSNFMAGCTNVNIEEVTPADPIPSSQLGLNESAEASAVLARFRGLVQNYVDESQQVSLEIEPRDDRRTFNKLVGKGTNQRDRKYTYCKAIEGGCICVTPAAMDKKKYKGMCKAHFAQFTERKMSTLTPPSDSEESEDEENDEMNASSPNKKARH